MLALLAAYIERLLNHRKHINPSDWGCLTSHRIAHQMMKTSKGDYVKNYIQTALASAESAQLRR